MNSRLRRFSGLLAAASALTVLISGARSWQAQNLASAQPADSRWTKLSVQLPLSETAFPAGDGADIANSQCLICHSAGMVLRQPALSESAWRATINKMRNAYGAPLPADQVDALVAYLSKVILEQSASDSLHVPK